MEPIFGPDFFGLIILPLLIFFARVIDVSLGTIRVIFISKGYKYYAPIIGFFEILVWLFAISQIMQHLNNIFFAVTYAAGFAAGTFVGVILEEKISLGTVLIQVITKENYTEIMNALQEKNFKPTAFDAEGTKGKVKMIFVITERHNTKKAVNTIKSMNPHAFYSIEDIKYPAEQAINPEKYFKYLKSFPAFKKGK